jgi:pSer/pThr/pTyr-binding forkhead associated (FHA) protein
MPQLVVQEQGATPRAVILEQLPLTVGRHRTADIILSCPSVSRRHAQLDRLGGEYWITDLDSTNGTWVNGRRIADSHRLGEGDIVRIGDRDGNSVSLTFYSSSPQPASHTLSLGTLDLGSLPSYVLGRDPNCQVHLNHPTVSRQHARLDRTGSQHSIRDLGSDNGTFVNSQPLDSTRLLQNGDLIQIGPFRLVYDQVSLKRYSSGGNYRLDAHGLRREVHVGRRLSLKRLLGDDAAPTHRVILDDINLSIQPREFVALVVLLPYFTNKPSGVQ